MDLVMVDILGMVRRWKGGLEDGGIGAQKTTV